MVKRPLTRSIWIGTALWLGLAGPTFRTLPVAQSQTSTGFGPDPTHEGQSRAHEAREGKGSLLSDSLPAKPSIPPAFTIPAEPLGFSAPGPYYLGQRIALASLDFLDESRLLFTFRVPGLMHRETGAQGEERQIRAVVLSLPDGGVEAEAVWPVHDYSRYLWMLHDGHFLLRDRDGLQLGDAALDFKPFLHFPGPVLWMELDPEQQYLVTDSREPAAATPRPGDVAGPASAAASVVADGQVSGGKNDMVLRILRRESGAVMLVSRVSTAVHLPLNSKGYLESLRGNGARWMLNLNFFSGGSKLLGHVDSACAPVYDFVSEREVLVTACESSGGHRLVAMDTEGRHLWDILAAGTGIWPLVVRSPNGLRLARETLAVTHPVNALSPLDAEDIKGQLVRVFDAATGKVALEAPAVPALDAGGNVAISPSGRRVAVLNAGSIQVFELPTPAPLSDPADKQ